MKLNESSYAKNKLEEKDKQIDELLKKIDDLTKKKCVKKNSLIDIFNLESELVDNLEKDKVSLENENKNLEYKIKNLNDKVNKLESDNIFLIENKSNFLNIIEEKNKIIDNFNKKINMDLDNFFNLNKNNSNVSMSNNHNNDKLTTSTQTSGQSILNNFTTQTEGIYHLESECNTRFEELIIKMNNEVINKFEIENSLNKQIKDLKIKIKSYQKFVDEIKNKDGFIKIIK